MEILILSGTAAAGMVVLALKMGLKRMLGHEVVLDLLITGLLMASLYGTMTGMTIALTAGLMTSISLMGLRKLVGYEKLEITRDRIGKRHIRWVEHAGVLT